MVRQRRLGSLSVSIFEKILRAGEGRIVRRLSSIAATVNSIEDNYADLTDAELRELTDQYKQRYQDGESLDDLMPEAFATAREAAKRVLGQRHYDVQVMGGAALHFGNIAEMKTGEGKPLTCVLPAYLNALSAKGVHVVTVNDYLAQRDAEWMGRIHRFLGLTVGVILPNQPGAEHRAAYECDITYGTNNEFGFDYRRDNMAWSATELVQRGHNFAIVDEVDSILVDEARTPLIISGPAEQSARWYTEFARVVDRLVRGKEGEGDYEVDESKRTVAISERGVAKVEDRLGIDNLYESVNTPLVGFLNNAIKAKELYKRDKDYVVMDGEVMIVDEHTGRILAGRRYNEGMHQAIEAKEGVEIQNENQTLATITLQNFFRLYDKLAGMTGTALTEAAEFHQIYKLGVVPIPTHRPVARLDRADLSQRGLDPLEHVEEWAAVLPEALERAKAAVKAEHEEVTELGGLYVLGTERHESRRIDNQLRGRSGRQGDPGESRFYLSLGDDLMVRFNGERVAAMMNLLRLPEDVPIEAKMVSKAIQSAQTQVEQQNFEIRKNVLKYDEVLNKQRTVIYDERRTVLEGADLS